jgi:hypothetical protein
VVRKTYCVKCTVNSVHLPSDPVGGRLGQARGRGRGVARGRGKVGGRKAGGRIGSCSLPIPRSWRSAGGGGGRGRGIIPGALRLLPPAAGDGSRRRGIGTRLLLQLGRRLPRRLAGPLLRRRRPVLLVGGGRLVPEIRRRIDVFRRRGKFCLRRRGKQRRRGRATDRLFLAFAGGGAGRGFQAAFEAFERLSDHCEVCS